jgi:UDP-2,3-diacylglucosamine hydrolase
MHSYFISDLHLTNDRPKTIQAFVDFLNHQATMAKHLYLLGDLFEFWIGDDAAALLGAQTILAQMKKLSEKVDCYFIAGNRDFLVGQSFTEQTGFTILPDETVIDLYGKQTLILHGDSLCIEDKPHQQFRKDMVTNMAWREEFLALDIPTRIQQAKQARMQSQQHKSAISMEIMDVTDSAVISAYKQHKVQQMIHGHTHRQNMHNYTLDDHSEATRYVLGDWHDTSSVLTAYEDGSITITNYDI